MAATQRAASPSTEQFPALDTPRTPTSLPTRSDRRAPGAENPHLLQPKSAHTFTTAELSPKSISSRYSANQSPAPLTGAAAMAEAKRRKQSVEGRQTSPNPAVEAVHALMGGGGMSSASTSPAPTKLSEPLRKAAEQITVPEHATVDFAQTSPTSMASFGSVDTTGAASAMTATASTLPEAPEPPQFTEEPGDLNEPSSYTTNNGHLSVAADDGNKAYSYPGPPPQEREGGPSRGMSLPGYGQSSPKSPASANKRHKCPYCSTDFTRHHNLKSHLLTHSQEKPYVCQTCNARFRRLHDLKRHTKLHTGERPHTCDKCGRRFARGDALARHNKGPGGCAGRRSSQGGEDDYFGGDHEDMDGVQYHEDDEDGTDPQARRVSEPSRKRAHLETPQDPNRQVYRQHSSTYPPPAMQHGRPGEMAPPQVVHPGSSAVTSPRDLSGHPSPAAGNSLGSSLYGGAPGQVFQQQGGMMTESPKPLSPGQPQDGQRLGVVDPNAGTSLSRNRSPSLTTQFQQAHFGRGSGGRTPPQPGAAQFPHAQANANAPQLPPLANMSGTSSQPQARAGLGNSYPGPGPSSLHQQHVPPQSGSNAGSLSSHGRSSGSSMRDVLATGGQDSQADLWAYVRNLESRFGRMQDEYELRISRMQDEIFSIRGQLSNQASYSSDMGGPPVQRY